VEQGLIMGVVELQQSLPVEVEAVVVQGRQETEATEVIQREEQEVFH
jgi:hypothetical protein